MKTLTGKRVLITGAARGIGLALASRFATERAEVVLTDVDQGALERATEQIGSAGSRPRAYRLDVTDPAAIDELRRRLHAEAGPLDVLVNNAGVVFGGAFGAVPLERHLTTYRINVEGVVAMTHAFLPELIERPEAHIVNVASASGLVGLPFGATYASSKWAVIGFSESLRLELELQEHDHIGVTAACPGYVGTGLFEGAEPPRTTHMLTTERVADKVVRAVLRNRIWVRMPWLIKVTPFLRGMLPTRLFDATARLMGATTSMAHWKGRSD